MLNKILIGLGLLVALVAGGIYLLASNIDSIVKAAVEEGGTRVTGVDVSLDKSSIDLANQRGALFGLKVGNPDSFRTARAIEFGAIGLELGEGSTTSLLVINKVIIENPEVTYEIGASGSNIDAIQQNVERTASMAGGSSAGKEKPAPASEGDIRIQINDFIITGGKVNVSSTLMQGKTLGTALPDIHLKDIGKKNGGASVGELIDLLISEISSKSGNVVGKLDLGSLGIENLEAIGKDAINKVKTDALKNAGEGTGKVIDGTIKDAGKALQGIFK